MLSGNILILKNINNGTTLKRHPDHLKKVVHEHIQDANIMNNDENDNSAAWREAFSDIERFSYGDFEDSFDMDCPTQMVQHPDVVVPEVPTPAVPAATAIRASTRNRTPNTRIFNDDYDTSS